MAEAVATGALAVALTGLPTMLRALIAGQKVQKVKSGGSILIDISEIRLGRRLGTPMGSEARSSGCSRGAPRGGGD